MTDWYAAPIFLTGDYPDSMKRFFGDRLPKIRKSLSRLLLGSADFCEPGEMECSYPDR